MEEFMRRAIESEQHDAAVVRERAALDDSRDDDELLALQTYFSTRARLDVAELLVAFTWPDESDELEDDETLASRLVGSLCAVADADEDGRLSESERMIFDEYLEAADQLLEDLGVVEEDRESLLVDADSATAARVQALLRIKIPAEGEDLEALVIGFGMQPLMPEATLDAVRRPRPGFTWARKFRGRTTLNHKHGKRHQTKHKMKHKTWAKHSAKQRSALIKARLHAHTSAAKLLNQKSNEKTRKAGGRRVV